MVFEEIILTLDFSLSPHSLESAEIDVLKNDTYAKNPKIKTILYNLICCS